MAIRSAFEALSASESVPYLALNPQGAITEFNAACQASSGYSSAEVFGKPLWKVLIPKRHRAEVRRRSLRPLGAGEARVCEEVWQCKIGAERHFAWLEMAIDDGVERIGFEMTHLVEREAALKSERDRLLRFMDHMPGIAFAKDGKRRLTYLSAGFERNFGYTSENALGSRDEDFLPRSVAKRSREIERELLKRGVSHLSIEWDQANVDPRRWMIHRFAIGDGSTRTLGGLSLDITSSIQVGDLFRASAEASPDALAILSANRGKRGKVLAFTLQYANSSAERLLRFAVRGGTDAELFHRLSEAESLRIRAALSHVMETGNTLVTTTQIPHESESSFYQLRATRAGENLTLEIRDITYEAATREAEVRYIADLETLASTDELTGLRNRMHFQRALSHAVQLAGETGQELALVIADIDQFKRINDTRGHLGGDQVLKSLGEVLRASTRSLDVVSRFGGEEFTIIMPGAPRDRAAEAAERLRVAIWNSFEGDVTASFGVSSLQGRIATEEELFSSADQALYAAKRAGRNRVEVAG